MPKPLIDLGERVRAARKARGLSQVQLAELCGISRRHISSIERGSNFGVENLLRLMGVLRGALRPEDILPAGSTQGETAQPPVDYSQVAEIVSSLSLEHTGMARQLRQLRAIMHKR